MAANAILGDVLKLIVPNHIKVNNELKFIATTGDLTDFNFKDIKKDWKVISAVPSLDTSVCLLQTKVFNESILRYKNVQLITISRDLPFVWNRVCESFINPEHMLLSDFYHQAFGRATGLYFVQAGLLCRSVMILDKFNVVRYLQIANPVTDSLDFKSVNAFLDSEVNIVK